MLKVQVQKKKGGVCIFFRMEMKVHKPWKTWRENHMTLGIMAYIVRCAASKRKPNDWLTASVSVNMYCTAGGSQAVKRTESTLCKQAVLMESGCRNQHIPPGPGWDQTALRPLKNTSPPSYMRLCPGGRCCQVTLRTRTKGYVQAPRDSHALQLIPWGVRADRWGRGSG